MVINEFLFVPQHNGMLKAKIPIAGQAKDFWTHKNIKRKLLNCIADVFFNQRYLQKRAHLTICKYKNGHTSQYANIKTGTPHNMQI